MSSNAKQSLTLLSNNITSNKSRKSPRLKDQDKKSVSILTRKESEKKQAVMKETIKQLLK